MRVLALFSIIYIFMLGMSVLSCQRKTCTYVPNLNLDSIPRNQFINAISSMYEDVGLTDHFPESWQKTTLRTQQCNSHYNSPCDTEDCQYYRCDACFVDVVSDTYMDSLIQNLNYDYKTLFYNDSILRFDPDLIKHPSYRLQMYYDTIHLPFYDFSYAVFNNEIEEDSIFYDGRSWPIIRYIPPTDLEVYVIDAKAGNYWINMCNAEKENRSILPRGWEHGYSRGIAVSKSCKKICWWTMAW